MSSRRVGFAVVVVAVAAAVVPLALAPAPAAAVPVVPTYTAVTAGSVHTCGLLSNGTVRCWGDNSAGQLGIGSTSSRSYPTLVPDLTGVESIDAGGGNTCARKTDSSLWCWGNNTSGQLGDGTTTTRLSPVKVSLNAVSSYTVGGTHTCAVSAGAVRCWGSNLFGQLGNGTTTGSSLPVTVSGTSGVVALGAGQWHTCASINALTNAISCWGANSGGQLGIGANTPATKTTPVTVQASLTPLVTSRSLALGQSHTCTQNNTSSPAVRCWGANFRGQLGDGTNTDRFGALSITLADVKAIDSGARFGCAATGSGAVRCWGSNTSGELGDGTNADRNSPTTAAGITGATDVATGNSHACAAVTDGRIRCWGNNASGQLGNNTTTTSFVPVTVVLAPGVPSKPVATAGDGQVTLSWTAPASNGGRPITGYSITPYIGNVAQPRPRTIGTATTRSIGGLTNGATYTFRVAAVNGAGESQDSIASDPVTPSGTAAPGSVFVPIVPCRIVDTRLAKGVFVPGSVRDVAVRGSGGAFAGQGGKSGGCGLPAGAGAVEVSVTAVGPVDDGFLRAYPGDGAAPNATFLNYSRGQSTTNTGTLALSSSGSVDLKARSYGSATHVVIDVQGYFLDP